MPSSQKTRGNTEPKKSTLSSKVSRMASTAASSELAVMLAAEMEKQRKNLKEDMATLICASLAPIQSSITSFREMVDTLGQRVTSVEVTAGENFETLSKMEKALSELHAVNATLVDRIDDLENRSRRANLCIINVPEGSEPNDDMLTFISMLLKDMMGNQVFATPPELDRAHRALKQKPKDGWPPRAIIVAFHKYQNREKALRWARQNEMRYKGHALRLYPDLSANLSKKRAAYKNIKSALYQKGIQFRLLYPARLRVSYGGDTLLFETPPEAETFYTLNIERKGGISADPEHED
ncbi:hypothetical protein DPEC_G00225780 [Dallia pectoralis]|uniref:Uncharacterized protein n=1 Tax=Dallia pectoralis TaxID=75939 RepID=A0ACC2G0N3_DALPE|nr:hypothetical protein DPEC_G00225780 [Dallia pectoralis]